MDGASVYLVRWVSMGLMGREKKVSGTNCGECRLIQAPFCLIQTSSGRVAVSRLDVSGPDLAVSRGLLFCVIGQARQAYAWQGMTSRFPPTSCAKHRTKQKEKKFSAGHPSSCVSGACTAFGGQHAACTQADPDGKPAASNRGAKPCEKGIGWRV